jgi:hypothetical protein
MKIVYEPRAWDSKQECLMKYPDTKKFFDKLEKSIEEFPESKRKSRYVINGDVRFVYSKTTITSLFSHKWHSTYLHLTLFYDINEKDGIIKIVMIHIGI